MAALISRIERNQTGGRGGEHVEASRGRGRLIVFTTLAWVTLALALPALSVYATAKRASNAREEPAVTGGNTALAKASATEPDSTLSQEMRNVALAFAAAHADGHKDVVKAIDLAPGYIPKLTAALTRLDPMLEEGAVRSHKAPTAAECASANGGKPAYPSESGRAGLQCYRSIKGDSVLAYRLEAAKQSDLEWREVWLRLRILDGVPHLQISAADKVVPKCAPTGGAAQGEAPVVSSGRQVLLNERVCLPAWRWESLPTQETGSVLDTGEVSLNLDLASGGGLVKVSAVARRQGAGGRWLSWAWARTSEFPAQASGKK